MVRADGVKANDVVREHHALVGDEVQELGRRGLAGEERELLIDCVHPGEGRSHCDLYQLLMSDTQERQADRRAYDKTTHWIEKPYPVTAPGRHEQT